MKGNPCVPWPSTDQNVVNHKCQANAIEALQPGSYLADSMKLARPRGTAIESNIEIMRYLADCIDESRDFVRLAPVPLPIVCFQYRTPHVSIPGDQAYLDRLNQRLLEAVEKDGRVFLSGTKIQGKNALRACSVNHRLQRQDVNFLLKVIREVGYSLIEKADSA